MFRDDQFAARSFAGDINPPPDASKIKMPTAAPISEDKMVNVSVPEKPAYTPPVDGSIYRVVVGQNGEPNTMYLISADGQRTRLGLAPSDMDTVAKPYGTYNDITKTYDIPEDIARAWAEGKQPYPEQLKQRFVAGEAGVVRGMWGANWLRGSVDTKTALEHGAIERQKILMNKRPDIAWNEAPFGKFVSLARWASLESAELIPNVREAMKNAGWYGAAVGGGALAISAATGGAGAAAIASMFSAGSAYGIAKYSADTSGGELALSLLEKGFDEKTVRRVAPVAGMISGVLELTGINLLAASYQRTAVRALFGSQGMKSLLSKWYVQYSKELGGEVGVEVAQEIVDQASNDLSAALDERPDLLSTSESITDALSQVFIKSLAGMAVLKMPGAALDAVSSRVQSANIRKMKADMAAGEADVLKMTPEQIEANINDGVQPIPIEKMNSFLDEKGKEKAFNYGQKNADNPEVKAALAAKGAALTIKRDALVEEAGGIANASPEVQTELVGLGRQIDVVNEISKGMEQARLDASKQLEPMLPDKETMKGLQPTEIMRLEQEGVLRTISRDKKAMLKELSAVEHEIATRENQEMPVLALNKAAEKLDARIAELDQKRLDILMSPPEARGDIPATIPAETLITLEREVADRINNAEIAGRVYGISYAKREVARVQTYIQELVKRSGLTPAQRSKFMAIMRNTKTVEQLNRNYPEIRDRIFEAERVNRAEAMSAILDAELRKGKIKSVKGKPVGKLGDPTVQRIVNDITGVMRLGVRDAEGEIKNFTEALLRAEQENLPGYSVEEHTLAQYRLTAAQYRAGLLTERDAAAFVQDVTAMVEGAKSAFMERRLAEKKQAQLNAEKVRKEILGDIVPPENFEKSKVESGSWAKGLSVPRVFVGAYHKGLARLSGIANLLAFRSGAKKGESLIEKIFYTDKAATEEQGFLVKWSAALDSAIEESYGIEGYKSARERLVRKTRWDLLQKHDLGTYTDRSGKSQNLIFSRDEAIKRYMEKQDPTLADSFAHPNALAYTPKMEEAIFGLLTEGDKKLAAAQLQLYRDLYKTINTIYRKIHGVDLPYNAFYSPVRALGYAEKPGVEVGIDAATEQLHSGTTMGGWGITRVKHTHPLEQLSSLSTYNNHIHALAHYAAWEGKVREWNRLLSDFNVKSAIIGVYGDEVYSALRAGVQQITTGGHERVIMRGFDKLLTKLISAEVIAKPLAAVKQLTALPAFMIDVPVEHFHIFLKNLAATPIEGIAPEWLTSDFVKARGLNQSQELNAMMEYAKKNSSRGRLALSTAQTMWLRFGDKASILLGGSALFKYYRSQGMTVAEAVEKTSSAARQTQSSGHIADLSVLQASKGYRLFTAYMNQPIQLIRLETEALMAMASKGFIKGEGRMSRTDAIKTVVITHFVIPMLFQAVVDAGWDDEHQKRAAVIGNFNSIPLLANLISNLYHRLAQEEEERQMGSGSILDSWVRDIDKAFRELAEAEDAEDYINAAILFSDPTFKALWGIPTKPITRTVQAAAQISRGEDFIDALKLSAGYSPYMIEEQNRRAK